MIILYDIPKPIEANSIGPIKRYIVKFVKRKKVANCGCGKEDTWNINDTNLHQYICKNTVEIGEIAAVIFFEYDSIYFYEEKTPTKNHPEKKIQSYYYEGSHDNRVINIIHPDCIAKYLSKIITHSPFQMELKYEGLQYIDHLTYSK